MCATFKITKPIVVSWYAVVSWRSTSREISKPFNVTVTPSITSPHTANSQSPPQQEKAIVKIPDRMADVQISRSLRGSSQGLVGSPIGPSTMVKNEHKRWYRYPRSTSRGDWKVWPFPVYPVSHSYRGVDAGRFIVTLALIPLPPL